ncbi:MAG TPA: hypothetical protein VI008_05265, partial [Rubrobacter sp.]
MLSMRPLAWHGETVYPRAAEAFLETTYEAYRPEFGDLWGAVSVGAMNPSPCGWSGSRRTSSAPGTNRSARAAEPGSR